MRRIHFLPLVLIPILLAGCETVNRQDRAVLRAHNVPANMYDKMLYGDPLSLEDVIALSQRDVPSGLIIKYMDEADTVYILRKPDVKRLRSSGVDEQVIAYMLSTAPQNAPNGPGPYVGYPYPGPPYPYGPYPYGYYDGIYSEPIIYVGGYGRWGGGWGHGGYWHHH